MVAGSIGRWGCAACALVATALAGVRPVRAQDQFVVLEQTYTATSANTSDSHYRVPPDAGTPSNWRSPIDYASGKVHARLDIQSKPSAKPTLYNICFEATPSYACMPYSPAYTKTGVIDFEYPFSAFYQYNDVDWSKGVRQIALILKDENETKPQGSPDFYPTTVHITLTVIRPGATYVPPPSEPVDAGMPPQDAGMDPEPPPEPDAGNGATSGTGSQPRGGSTAPPPPSTPQTMAGSGAMTSPPANPPAMPPPAAPMQMAAPITAAQPTAARPMPAPASNDVEGGCAALPMRGGVPWWFAMCVLLLWRRRARAVSR